MNLTYIDVTFLQIPEYLQKYPTKRFDLWMEDRQDIWGYMCIFNTSDNTKSVGAHFSQIGHTIYNLQLNILMGSLNNTDKRKMFELKLIKKFNAINDGLNIDSSYLRLYNI